MPGQVAARRRTGRRVASDRIPTAGPALGPGEGWHRVGPRARADAAGL